MANLNKINYVDQDFSTAMAEVRNFLSTNYPDEYNDYLAANLGTAFIDIISYAEQNMFWYINRKITDLYFPTAVTPRAISKLARMLGYKSRGAVSAECSVSLTFPDAPFTFPVQINKGFQWQGPNNTVWEYRGAVTLILQPGQTSIAAVTLSQGETTVNNFISNGNANQFFELLAVPQGKFVERDSVVILVDGEEWTEQPLIPFSNENNYETNLLAFPPVLRFGDGVQGNIPPAGSGIQITYVISDGFRGRITSNAIGDPVVGLVAQFQNIDVTVTQSLPSVGGDDPEDIRSITVNAPKFQRVQDRAITKDDYDFLANGFDNVAKADAQIVRSISGDYATIFLLESICGTVNQTVTGAYAGLSPLIEQINADVDGIVSSVATYSQNLIVDIIPTLNTISGYVDTIASDVTATIVQMRSDVETPYQNVVTALYDTDATALLLIDQIATVFDVKNVSIYSYLDAISGAVSGCPSAQPVVAANITYIKSKLSDMRASLVATATTSFSNIDVQTNTASTNLDTIISEIEALSGEVSSAIASEITSIAINLGVIVDTISGSSDDFYGLVSGYLVDMDSAVSGINTLFYQSTSGLYQSVCGDINELYAHLDENISNSCQANLVQVKVLGKDANRKYVAPLQSTLDSLKAYLEERKDIVQTVSCVEGTVDVIEADVTIEVRVANTAVEDDVVQAIKDSLDKSDVAPLGILVERAFNKPLYVWEIDGAIRDNVPSDHIDYLNVKINGPAQYLDISGNLVTPTGRVIQTGTIIVTALPRFT